MTETIKFEVGDGATVCFWTDRRAGTIIEATEKRVTWQADKVTRTDDHGMSDAQSYSYERDTDGPTRVFSLRKNGRWVQAGESIRGTRLVAGRAEYYDYSF